MAIAPFPVCQGHTRDLAQGFVVERGKLEDAGAGDQGLVDFEVGVFGCRPDEDDDAVFDVGQKGVLLRFVEAVDFVHKKDGLLPVHPASFLRGRYRRPYVFHSAQDSIDGDKVSSCRVGDNASEGGFAGTGWAIENDRRKLIGLDGAPQQATRPNDRILANKFIQCTRAHTGSQWLFFFQQILDDGRRISRT